jgi:probable O-glycosylation ligase (exosortase A-associated)
MVSCVVAVLGTYSRGALLAVIAMGMFLWWKGKHKLQALVIVLLAIPFALATMPEKCYERMETIRTYELDTSASMRLNSWQTMWNLAKSRPVVGAGFEAGTQQVYARYSPDPSFPPQTAHSIYFQALGEHGFVGLALYLLMFGAFWRKASRVIETTRDHAELQWAGDLSRMMQVTLIGFAVGGAFLSLVNFDVPYYLVALMIALAAQIERQVDLERTAYAPKTATAMQASAET